jgi:hypothetical protein
MVTDKHTSLFIAWALREEYWLKIDGDRWDSEGCCDFLSNVIQPNDILPKVILLKLTSEAWVGLSCQWS